MYVKIGPMMHNNTMCMFYAAPGITLPTSGSSPPPTSGEISKNSFPLSFSFSQNVGCSPGLLLDSHYQT